MTINVPVIWVNDTLDSNALLDLLEDMITRGVITENEIDFVTQNHMIIDEPTVRIVGITVPRIDEVSKTIFELAGCRCGTIPILVSEIDKVLNIKPDLSDMSIVKQDLINCNTTPQPNILTRAISWWFKAIGYA